VLYLAGHCFSGVIQQHDEKSENITVFCFCVVPAPKFYVQLNPVQIHFDLCSCLWLNSFALNLHHSLLSSNLDQQQASAALTYIDVKLEAIMPRVCHISVCTVLMKSSLVGGFLAVYR
jgi:hypothetical protein